MHLVVRPLGSETPIRSVTVHSVIEELGSTLIEEESQCSVVLYENGTASGSDVVSATSPLGVVRAPSCEPNFRNCLVKSSIVLNETTVEEENDLVTPCLQIAENTSTMAAKDRYPIVEPKNEIKSNGELFLNEDSSLINEPSEDTEGQKRAELICEINAINDQPDFVSDSNILPGIETQSQTETSTEKKAVTIKNKLPIAVMKPDNPRAIRYWLDQRRAARGDSSLREAVEDEDVRCQDSEDFELFHANRDYGVHDALGQRVLQVRLISVI